MSDIHVHHHYHCGDKCSRTEHLLQALIEKVDTIMATQAQLAEKLNQLNDQLTKVGNESEATLKLVQELKDQIANNQVTPELQAAFDKVAAAVKKVDDLIPDPLPPS